MRKSLGWFLTAVVGLTPLTLAGDSPATDVKDLQGSWRVVSLESDDRKASAEDLEAMKDGR